MKGFRAVLRSFFVLYLLIGSVGLAHGFEKLLERGIVEYRRDNYEEALNYFTRAREAAPRSSVVAFYLGLVHKQTGNLPEAARYYREALTFTPPVQDAYTELIEVLYRLDLLQEAKEWVMKAEKLGISPASISFLSGLILAREGKSKEAIQAFTRAKEADKAIAQAADFQIAMIYAKERRFDKARASLMTVLAIDPGSDLAAFAREYEASLARVMDDYKVWRLSVGVSYQYDDNILSKPSAPVGNPVVDALTGEKDSSVMGTFSIAYSPFPSGPWGVSAHYQFYANTYFRTHSHNLINQALSLAPSYTFGRGVLTIPATYNFVLLNQRRFMDALSLRPTLNIQLLPGHIGQFSLGLSNRVMSRPVLDPHEDRDAQVYSAGLGYLRPFQEGKGLFNIRYEFTLDNAKGSNWVNSSHRFAAVFLVPVLPRVSFMITGDALIQDYSNVHTLTGAGAPPGFPLAPTKRQDRTYSGSANIKAELYKGLKLSFTYSHSRAESNIAIYDYRRNIYSAGLEFSF